MGEEWIASVLSILGGHDDLLSFLYLRVGTLFTLPVTWHDNISFIAVLKLEGSIIDGCHKANGKLSLNESGELGVMVCYG